MLIVPYGIETCIAVFVLGDILVLIVPYGIETFVRYAFTPDFAMC